MPIGTNISALSVSNQRLAVSSHNLANLNTQDYKALRSHQVESPSGAPELHVERSDQAVDIVHERLEHIQTIYDLKAQISILKTEDEMLGQAINIKA